jgi:hypothetical protein
MPHVSDEILRASGGPTIPQGLLESYKLGGAISDDLDDAEREFLIEASGLALLDELIADPEFGQPLEWTAGTGWVVEDGRAICNGLQPTPSLISTAFPIDFDGINRVEIVSQIALNGDFFFVLGTVRLQLFNTDAGTHRRFVDLTGQSGSPSIEAAGGATSRFESFSIRPLAGAAASNYQTNDMWFAYLRSLGYTGALPDMWLAFWAAQP